MTTTNPALKALRAAVTDRIERGEAEAIIEIPAATTCEICAILAPTASHPCRFERACSCWRGRACSSAK